MRKSALMMVLLPALALLLAAAPAAFAGDSYTGNWSGTWQCTGPDCKKASGPVHGNITQKDTTIKGQFTFENTVAGTLTGPLNGWVDSSGALNGTIQTSDGYLLSITGSLKGGALQGEYRTETMGMGTFSLNR